MAKGDELVAQQGRVRAAQYLRMSNEHQQYSVDNQSAAIGEYAVAHGFEIVATYADEGKSGVTAERREGLLRLLDDVEAKRNDFTVILVYDVSRWGRFQNPDDAAIYEVRCRWAGVPVHYCAEHFENDGSVISSIMKALKRAMAAEYSRELSAKVTEGHVRMLERGFHQGGFPSFGMQRVLLDCDGNRKGVLKRGERKYLQSDRVVLEPGPREDVAIVNEIYRRYLHGASQRALVDDLNKRAILNSRGRPWTIVGMLKLLSSEAYIGNVVWGKSTCKLGSTKKLTPPNQWIRHEQVFAPTVDPRMFWKVQAELRRRAFGSTDAEILDGLRKLVRKHGVLSKEIIDKYGTTSSSIVCHRFGCMRNVYARLEIGEFPANQQAKFKVLISLAVKKLCKSIERQFKGHVAVEASDATIQIRNKQSSAIIVLARHIPKGAKPERWYIEWRDIPVTDIVIVGRMASGNRSARDFLAIARNDIESMMPLARRIDEAKFHEYRIADLRHYLSDIFGTGRHF